LRRLALGPLEDYAERRRADLLETLRTFVACDLDRRRAAERLHVHPNTLDYRLRRVEELTGLRLSSTSDLVVTCLALKQRGDGHGR
jgi:DNA-binding PucR family transcriptional regulator